MTEATWVTVVVTVFEVLGSCVFPRLSWNEIVPLLPITVPAVTPALTVTVNCRDPEPPATIAPMLQVTTPPVRVPPPVALWNVVLDGTKSESETLVAPTLPALLYESVYVIGCPGPAVATLRVFVSVMFRGFTTVMFVGSFAAPVDGSRSEEHTSELQSPCNLVCRLLLEKKKKMAMR